MGPLALQWFQRAKAEMPLLNRTLDVVTFATLIQPLAQRSERASTKRALQLYAEMRSRSIRADVPLVSTMFAACKGLSVQVALRLRLDLQAQGWSHSQLAPYDRHIVARLPSLAEIMADQERWAALGVRP